MSNKIIVVEGAHDVQAIKRVFKDANCLITNGSEVLEETKSMLKTLALDNDIIVFTDPDFPGERIRSKIHEIVPASIDVFIKKDLCISKNKKKVGVEHATDEDIYNALCPFLNGSAKNTSDVKMKDIIELGLNGGIGSKQKRDTISSKLNIGVPNAKTFLQRIRMLGLSLDTLKKMVGEISE